MDVTFVATGLSIGSGTTAGGAQRSLHKLAMLLTEEGYDITVLLVGSGFDIPTTEVPYSVVESGHSHPSPPERLDIVLPGILSDHDDTDLFHLFGPEFVPGGARFRKRAETPVVARLNSFPFCFNMSLMDGSCHAECNVRKRISHYNGSLTRSLSRAPMMAYADYRLRQFNHLDHLFAQSPSVKEIYRDVGVTDPEMSVVPNAFDQVFSIHESVESPFEGDNFDVLFVGRLKPEKGVRELVKAASQLRDGVKIHIVGDGSLAGEIRERSFLLETVEFHGYVEHDQLPRYYRSADLFVHPGTWPDPCPRTVLEAMASRTPLVVTDIGGPPWMAGDACVTVAPRDPGALAEAIRHLESDESARRTLRSAMKTELEQFRPQEIMALYRSVYQSL
jgi:glycosyltransferase involved in cell wall biosynthesis